VKQLSSSQFYLVQIAIGAVFLVAAWFFFRPKQRSNFKDYGSSAHGGPEAGRPGANQDGKTDALAGARLKQPLRIGGVSITGPPHEILGVPPGAPAQDIQRAYKDLMKRFHPDMAGPQGSERWKDAQKIAEAINHAKDELLRRHRS